MKEKIVLIIILMFISLGLGYSFYVNIYHTDKFFQKPENLKNR